MEKFMAKFRSSRRKILLTFLIIFGVVLVKIIIAMIMLPKASIDYIAKYNELTKPDSYDPLKNAAYNYQKAFDIFNKMPEEVSMATSEISYNLQGRLSDIAPKSLLMMEEWVDSNSGAMEYLRIAAKQPYCWFERKSDNNDMLGITVAELSSMKYTATCLLWGAKLSATKGDFKSAIEDILDCYRIGNQYLGKNTFLMHPYSGLSIMDSAGKTGLGMVYEFNPSLAELKYFQESLQTIIDNGNKAIDIEGERLCLYDMLQRIFLDWKRGFGKAAFRHMRQLRCMCDDNNLLWLNSFVGPSRRETARQIERFFEIHEKLKDKTPWQIDHQCSVETDEIVEITDNFFMRLFSPAIINCFALWQRTNVQTDALITVIAVLRFKGDNGRVPETLDELVAEGYIRSVPQDPYSEGGLSYVVVGDDFKLYSFGKDFEDNKGEPEIEETFMFVFSGSQAMRLPGIVMGPGGLDPNRMSVMGHEIKQAKPQQRLIYRDIVYWPVRPAIHIRYKNWEYAFQNHICRF